jgi:protein TonB
VDPVYPEQARDRRIQGTVKLQAFIDTDGTVQAVEVLQAEVTQDGEAIAAGDEHDTQYLVTSAMEAVRQWRYEPATRNGVPVPVFLTIQTDFRLN